MWERERTVQKAFVDTTKIDQNKWELPKVDSGWSALRQTMHDRDVAQQVGIRSVGGHHHSGGGGGGGARSSRHDGGSLKL